MDGCPNTEAALLEANCQVLVGGVVQHTNPDCSPTYSAKHPVADPTQHIDILPKHKVIAIWILLAFG
jgi:hypothetical protein